jgi:transcriptional regulator of heat shock response
MKMEQTECCETSAYKIQAPGNYSEEGIQQIHVYFDNHIRNVKELFGKMQSALSFTVGGVSCVVTTRLLKFDVTVIISSSS